MTMDPKTKTAMLASIAKWQANAKAETPNDVALWPKDCPLCRVYHHYYTEVGKCDGCPVRASTGQSFCNGTPYYAARDAVYEWGMSVHEKDADEDAPAPDVYKARFHTAAQAMADFLTDLLPEGKQ